MVLDYTQKVEFQSTMELFSVSRNLNRRTEESTLDVDSSVPLMHHDPSDLGLICLLKKRKIRFRIYRDLRI